MPEASVRALDWTWRVVRMSAMILHKLDAPAKVARPFTSASGLFAAEFRTGIE